MMRKQNFFWASVVLLGLFCAPLHAATVYIWTDENGEQHITDTPPPAQAKVQRKLEAADEPEAPAMSDVNRQIVEDYDSRMQNQMREALDSNAPGATPAENGAPSAPGAEMPGQGAGENPASYLDSYFEQQRQQEAVARAAANAKARGDMRENLNIRLQDAQEALASAETYERRARRSGDSRAAVRASNQQEVVRSRITLLEEQLRQADAAEKERIAKEEAAQQQAAEEKKARDEAAKAAASAQKGSKGKKTVKQ